MTIVRAQPAGFGVGDKLTSTVANAMDINSTSALDKRAAQTDTLASIVTATGGGRIVPQVLAGPNADTTLTMAGGAANVLVTTLTANRFYTLSATGAQTGDTIYINNSSTFRIGVIDAVSTVLMIYIGADSTNAESLWGTFIFDGTRWQLDASTRRPALVPALFTSSGSWVCPQGVTVVVLDGWGGGGGGGGGLAGSTSTTASAPGGGGGGAAWRRSLIVPVTAGSTYVVTIGAAGAGGAVGTDGTSGGDTLFSSLATFVGAAGGVNAGSQYIVAEFAPGGAPSRLMDTQAAARFAVSSASDGIQRGVPGAGGPAYNSFSGASSRSGNGSLDGFAGGVGGTVGAFNTPANGGGAGAGGGGGPGGVGAVGGNGGAGGSSGSSAPGLVGSNAAANTGAGGGGGGSSGQCTAAGSPGVGAAGGNGGSGQLTVTPLR